MDVQIATFLTALVSEFIAIVGTTLGGLAVVYGGLIGLAKLFKWVARLVGGRA